MADANDTSRLVVTFENHPVHNPNRSREEGAPKFDDMVICRIRTAGDRLQAPAFPAHAEVPGAGVDEQGDVITYAMKYSDQYKRFMEGRAQTMDGTPLSELPFLTEAKRRELKALHIFTAESLAALDGQPLKTVGQGGRELKMQAQAYLDNAKGSANVTKLAAENEALKAMLDELQKERAQGFSAATERVEENLGYGEGAHTSNFAGMNDDQLKDLITDLTGSRPRGNPSRQTLLRMAEEASGEQK